MQPSPWAPTRACGRRRRTDDGADSPVVVHDGRAVEGVPADGEAAVLVGLDHHGLLLRGGLPHELGALGHVPHEVVGDDVDAELHVAEDGVLGVGDGHEVDAERLGDLDARLKHLLGDTAHALILHLGVEDLVEGRVRVLGHGAGVKGGVRGTKALLRGGVRHPQGTLLDAWTQLARELSPACAATRHACAPPPRRTRAQAGKFRTAAGRRAAALPLATGVLEAPTRRAGPAGAKAEAEAEMPSATRILRENIARSASGGRRSRRSSLYVIRISDCFVTSSFRPGSLNTKFVQLQD